MKAASTRPHQSRRSRLPADNGTSSTTELEIEGKRLRVSNLEKVLFPKARFTKGQVIDYYIRISPVLLPHLKNRPLTLKRYPDGVDGPFFL